MASSLVISEYSQTSPFLTNTDAFSVLLLTGFLFCLIMLHILSAAADGYQIDATENKQDSDHLDKIELIHT